VIDPLIVDVEIVDEWLEDAMRAAKVFTLKEIGRKLWDEATARAKTGEIAPADADAVKELISARVADLEAA